MDQVSQTPEVKPSEQHTSQPEMSSNSSNKKGNRTLLIVFGILGAILLFCCCMFFAFLVIGTINAEREINNFDFDELEAEFEDLNKELDSLSNDLDFELPETTATFAPAPTPGPNFSNPYIPGKSICSEALCQDAIDNVLLSVFSVVDVTCNPTLTNTMYKMQGISSDSIYSGFPGAEGGWTETWTFDGCDRGELNFDIEFVPDGYGGTYVNASSEPN